MEKQKDVFITLNDKEVKLPRTFKEKILWLGPSLVLCSIAIGSGEAIITPYFAAMYGLGLLWVPVMSALCSGIRRILCSWFVQSPWTKRLGDRYHVYPLDLHCILPGSRLAAWSRCCRIWCIALYGCYL